MAKGIYCRGPHSQETKQKIRLRLMGNKNGIGNRGNTGGTSWNKGISVSEEHKRHLSDVLKGQHHSLATEIKPGMVLSPLTQFGVNGKGQRENHWLWQGGITKLAGRIRKSFKYRQWRSDVFERDDYTCQFCGARGHSIHADHVKTFASILRENQIDSFEKAMECEELWNINNGRTLCVSCHKTTDTYLKK